MLLSGVCCRTSRTFLFNTRCVQNSFLPASKVPLIRVYSSAGPGNGSKGLNGKYILVGLAAVVGSHLLFSAGTSMRKKLKEDAKKPVYEKIKLPHMKSAGAKAVKYKGYILPEEIVGSLETISSFPVKKEDIFVVSHPKSGTTWLQEIVYLIHNGLDFEEASSQVMEERFPYLEYPYPGVKAIKKKPGPRLIKSHLPFDLLPEETQFGRGKVLCIVRNPKDTSVSSYFFLRMLTLTSYEGDMASFIDSFTQGLAPYGPWWRTTRSYWSHREDSNVLVLKYEELKQNLPAEIQKIAKFLGKELSPSQVSKLAEHCAFQKMKNNPSVNYEWWDELGLRHKERTSFMRKGRVGDWKNHYTQEQSDAVDRIVKTELAPLGLDFTYELPEDNT